MRGNEVQVIQTPVDFSVFGDKIKCARRRGHMCEGNAAF